MVHGCTCTRLQRNTHVSESNKSTALYSDVAFTWHTKLKVPVHYILYSQPSFSPYMGMIMCTKYLSALRLSKRNTILWRTIWQRKPNWNSFVWIKKHKHCNFAHALSTARPTLLAIVFWGTFRTELLNDPWSWLQFIELWQSDGSQCCEPLPRD